MTLAAALAALAGLAACSAQPIHNAQPINKTASPSLPPRTIVMQMPDASDANGLFFAEDVAQLSRGALKVTIDRKTYISDLPSNEARLTADLRSGKVGFAYQPARDWAAVGVPGFQALMAPFAVTTVAASQRVAASPVASTVLNELAGYGAVGLGLLAGEPRQILSIRPLFTLADFAGQPIRIVDNPQTAALVTALGSRPVQGLASNAVAGPLHNGSLTGVESSPTYIEGDAYESEAHYLTAYGMFAKFEVLVASKGAWSALPSADQAVIRHAIADTQGNSGGVGNNEALTLTQLCQQGVVLDQPTSAQLNALSRAAAGATPASPDVSAVARLIAALPGTGPQPDAIPVPQGCRVAADAAEATRIHSALSSAGA